MLLLAVALVTGLLVHDGASDSAATPDPVEQPVFVEILSSVDAPSSADTLSSADARTSADTLPSVSASSSVNAPSSVDALSWAFGVEFNFAAQPVPLNVAWVAAHVETPVWSGSTAEAEEAGLAHLWVPLQVTGEAQGGRLPIWDPSERRTGWVQASDVGPVDPALVGTAYLPPIGRPLAWSGAARVTMYTCVELGGCAATASGRWPTLGMVAVDPSLIPLGSLVWVQGLGTFLAADTGSLVHGTHLDVYSSSYDDAVDWGVQERAVLVYPPQ